MSYLTLPKSAIHCSRLFGLWSLLGFALLSCQDRSVECAIAGNSERFERIFAYKEEIGVAFKSQLGDTIAFQVEDLSNEVNHNLWNALTWQSNTCFKQKTARLVSVDRALSFSLELSGELPDDVNLMISLNGRFLLAIAQDRDMPFSETVEGIDYADLYDSKDLSDASFLYSESVGIVRFTTIDETSGQSDIWTLIP